MNLWTLLMDKFRPQPAPSLITAQAGMTDKGKKRQNNEDAFGIGEDTDFFVVADGMGGHLAGEVASQMAVRILLDHFPATTCRALRNNNQEIQHALLGAFHAANQQVMAAAAVDPDKKGMGCTMVTALLDGDTLHCCHVGDARAYLLRQGNLQQITTDHSATMTMPATDSRPAFTRQVVTRVIGSPFPEAPEYHCLSITQADRILLCTDGLWNMLEDTTISSILDQGKDPDAICHDLVAGANEAGGRDNITVVTVFC